MFPYLKSKSEFLKDCEKILYKVDDSEGFYRLINNDEGYYSYIRGCKYQDENHNDENHNDVNLNSKLCKGIIKSEGTPCELPCEFNRCHWLLDDNYHSPCEECGNISEIVALLVENVNKANWGESEDDRIGNVEFSQIQAWCQSVCIYMHDVLKQVTNENIVVGLEFYTDNTVDDHVRADVILAGYDKDQNKKIVIVELKQYTEKYSPNEEDKAINQVKSYCKSIRDSVDNFGALKIELIPCVYFHNYIHKTQIQKEVPPTNSTDLTTYVFYGDIESTPSSRTKGIKALAEFINTKLSGNGDAKQIIKDIKSNINVLSVDEMAKIMYGMYEKRDIEKILKMLRPDQKNAYKGIKDALDPSDSSYGCTNIISGASGSGKTLLVALLIAYCLEKNIKVVFLYRGTAFVNAVTNSISELIKKDLGNNHIKERIIDNIITKFKYKSRGNIIVSGTKFTLPSRVKRWKDNISFYFYDETPLPNIGERHLLLFDEFHRFTDIEYIDSVPYEDTSVDVKKSMMKDYIYSNNTTTVLLIDALQQIDREKDAVSFLNKIKTENKIDLKEYNLWSQFRCNSCEGFVTWVEQALQLESENESKYVVRNNTKDYEVFLEDLDYEVVLLDDISSTLDKDVVFLTENKDSLMNYCTLIQFSDPQKTDPTKKPRNGFVKAINDDDGNREIGNSYRSQGVEYNEVLVYIDERIDCIDGKIAFTEEAIKDMWDKGKIPEDMKSEIRRICKNRSCATWTRAVAYYEKNNTGVSTSQAECIIGSFFERYLESELDILKRKYRILLTRGLKKCYIFAKNDSLREYLKSKEQRPAWQKH